MFFQICKALTMVYGVQKWPYCFWLYPLSNLQCFESLFCFHLQLSISSGRSLWCSITGKRSFWGVHKIRCFPLAERAALRNVVLFWRTTEKVRRKKIPSVIRYTSLDKILSWTVLQYSGRSIAVCYTAVSDVHAFLSLSPPYVGLELQWSQTPDEGILSFLCLCYPF
jgi:hypothetical protein